jgi:DNA polymerase-3 subunit alpha
MTDGSFVYIEGSVQPKQWSKDSSEVEFKVNKIDYLSNLRKQQTKCLKISVPLKGVDHRFIEDIEKIFQKNEGTYPVKFNIYDTVNNLDIDMPSRFIRVDVTDELIKELDAFKVEYVLE